MKNILDIGTPLPNLDWLYEILSSAVLPPPESLKSAAKYLWELGEYNMQIAENMAAVSCYAIALDADGYIKWLKESQEGQ